MQKACITFHSMEKGNHKKRHPGYKYLYILINTATEHDVIKDHENNLLKLNGKSMGSIRDIRIQDSEVQLYYINNSLLVQRKNSN